MSQSLLSEVEAFLSETGMSVYALGYGSVRNNDLVRRLRLGGTVLTTTDVKIRAFMAAERQRRSSEAAT